MILLECDVFSPIAAIFIAVIVIIVLIDKPLPAWIHPLLFYVQVSGRCMILNFCINELKNNDHVT